MRNNNSRKNKNEEFQDQVEGRNSVLELLDSDRDINKIFIERGEKHGSINKIIVKAREKKVVIVEVDRQKLNKMAQTENHQGVIAIVPPFNYCEVKDILDEAYRKNEKPFIIILDGIEDPHNLGAIIRTVEAFHVEGIIIKKHHQAPINATVAKVSTGAIANVKIMQVTNLTQTLIDLKEKGFWIVAAEAYQGVDYQTMDYQMPLVLVVGSEGFGISRLVKEQADFNVFIPMQGKVNSLNVSVATAILLAHIQTHKGQ